MPASHRTVLIFLAFALSCSSGRARLSASDRDPMLGLNLQGEAVQGMSLLWTSGRAVVLQRDGRLFDFDPADASQVRVADTRFDPASQAEMRSQLYREFGDRYQVTATSHYLVVHPTQGGHWPEVFESLHRAFLQHCRTRTLPLRKSRFPMVAIVFPDRASFLRYAQSDGNRPVGGNVLGYYSRNSNRVALYDHGATSGGVSATMRHEAAHQSAFNWGIHSRVAKQPHWIIEGFGTMFEAEGIHDSASNRTLQERVNRELLISLRKRYPDSQSLAAAIDDLVQDDRTFANDAESAYSVAWAMTFFLADRRPDVMRQLVTHYSSRLPFITYPAEERRSDFERAIGISIPMLASQIQQFLGDVR
ncbi:hypothetical protein Poly24_16770 [Rosistilla carotiformis]|uniref:DUF1570 domain-containing protein n=1 Tax=Rosistilla carotiformis TaxID=2528017 RepID=A0A518JQZ5_9BACT|nr:DUF1570 domain-containing protein [Rosistilla carotiformis]QDV67971.1 hypothetical protein Poly24_16770 [Rosistilla carotiformis]